jgi:hypothetical protein
MTKSTSQKLVVLIISISLMLGVMTTAVEISGENVTQPNVTLTPHAYLPLISQSFPFTKSEYSPFYLQNFINNAGCDWMGVAGEVLDIERNPVAAGSYTVHVWGSGIDARVTVGTAPAYSPSGWELFLFDSPVVRDYEIQLEASSGTAVSAIYAFQTRASCTENLVRFDFVQIQ